METIRPQYKFSGNLFNRYPILLNYAPLPDNHRLRYTKTPIELTWIFVKPNGKIINFYPIFLKLTSKKTGINYHSISYKLNLKQSANIHYSNYIKY